ncbi:ribosomal protein S18-alanine N-acetyltransferase [Salinicola aestuarinus]|uniref:ribosomal protein S18-alanine N-acetyltransferase n=1 Tax=Salinicola aestuarinus TaxID=1949082 RepID=UPI000DA1FC0B|nr:ribosomal protein S18-alanine N-acetyltransferase [Salinicola aestuarinus]
MTPPPDTPPLPDNAHVRQLDVTDLDAVMAFEARANPDAWSAALFERALIDRDQCVWGLYLDGTLCATAFIAWLPYDAELQSISVSPIHRRQGLAAALLARLKGCAVARGCEKVLLEVRASNHAAQALYQRCGFAVDGRRRGYYRCEDGRGEDAILMSCELSR